MIAKKCLMPDLTDADPPAVGCYIASRLAGAGYHDQMSDSLIKSAARLIDKARREYSFARETIEQEIAENEMTYEEIMERGTGQYMYTMAIISHFENCINALVRTYKLLDPKFKTNKKVNDVRNSIEHTDERIREGTTGPIAIDVSEDSSSIRIFFRKYSNDDRVFPEEIVDLKTEDLAKEIVRTYQEVRKLI